eukprot:scaffold31848_cov69-Phaeocystis_antarctica.AAC.1
MVAERAQGRGEGRPSPQRNGASHLAEPRRRRHPRTPRPTGDRGAAQQACGARAAGPRSRQRSEHAAEECVRAPPPTVSGLHERGVVAAASCRALLPPRPRAALRAAAQPRSDGRDDGGDGSLPLPHAPQPLPCPRELPVRQLAEHVPHRPRATAAPRRRSTVRARWATARFASRRALPRAASAQVRHARPNAPVSHLAAAERSTAAAAHRAAIAPAHAAHTARTARSSFPRTARAECRRRVAAAREAAAAAKHARHPALRWRLSQWCRACLAQAEAASAALAVSRHCCSARASAKWTCTSSTRCICVRAVAAARSVRHAACIPCWHHRAAAARSTRARHAARARRARQRCNCARRAAPVAARIASSVAAATAGAARAHRRRAARCCPRLAGPATKAAIASRAAAASRHLPSAAAHAARAQCATARAGYVARSVTLRQRTSAAPAASSYHSTPTDRTVLTETATARHRRIAAATAACRPVASTAHMPVRRVPEARLVPRHATNAAGSTEPRRSWSAERAARQCRRNASVCSAQALHAAPSWRRWVTPTAVTRWSILRCLASHAADHASQPRRFALPAHAVLSEAATAPAAAALVAPKRHWRVLACKSRRRRCALSAAAAAAQRSASHACFRPSTQRLASAAPTASLHVVAAACHAAHIRRDRRERRARSSSAASCGPRRGGRGGSALSSAARHAQSSKVALSSPPLRAQRARCSVSETRRRW